MDDLKKCPFCGKHVAECMTVAEADLMDDEWPNYEWAVEHYTVVCSWDNGGCGACTGGICETREDAIKRWNRRD